MARGDPTVLRLVREAAELIGEVVATLVHFYNPARVTIGGSVAAASDDLLAGIRSVVYQRALPLATRNLVLANSVLGEFAGVAGAAVLGIERVLSADGIGVLMERGRLRLRAPLDGARDGQQARRATLGRRRAGAGAGGEPVARQPEQRIAGAPISWGVCEVPGWGHQLAPQRVLTEMREVGLAATEVGPDGFLPADPAKLAAHARRARPARRRRVRPGGAARARARPGTGGRPGARRLRRRRARRRSCCPPTAG